MKLAIVKHYLAQGLCRSCFGDLPRISSTCKVGVYPGLLGMTSRPPRFVQEEFLVQYEDLEALLSQCYPSEQLSPSSPEMRELFRTV